MRYIVDPKQRAADRVEFNRGDESVQKALLAVLFGIGGLLAGEIRIRGIVHQSCCYQDRDSPDVGMGRAASGQVVSCNAGCTQLTRKQT
jgi:hypothetical protein